MHSTPAEGWWSKNFSISATMILEKKSLRGYAKLSEKEQSKVHINDREM